MEGPSLSGRVSEQTLIALLDELEHYLQSSGEKCIQLSILTTAQLGLPMQYSALDNGHLLLRAILACRS